MTKVNIYPEPAMMSVVDDSGLEPKIVAVLNPFMGNILSVNIIDGEYSIISIKEVEDNA